MPTKPNEIRVDISKAQDILDFALGKGVTQAIVISPVIIEYFGDYPIRIIQDINGEVWFVAKDVCDALEIGNSREAIRPLDDDEKGVKRIDTLGGTQSVNVISESGRYRLTMRCDKSRAKPFQDWVVKLVLPSIRSTGSYSINPESETSLLVGAIKDLVILVKDLLAEKIKPAALPPVREITPRLKISQIIRAFAARQTSNYTYEDAWNDLYLQFKYRYNIDLKGRARNKNSNPLDEAEKMGVMNDLLALAVVYFE